MDDFTICNLLDKKKASQSLHDGFTIVFGEKHRKFLNEIGNKIIELGIKNGHIWSKYKKLENIDIRHHINSEHTKPEDVVKMYKDLKLFFTKDELDSILAKRDNKLASAQFYSKGRGEFDELIEKTLKKEDFTLKQPNFDYFKNFKLSNDPKFKSVTLINELGLDFYYTDQVEYYKEENELFYHIEDVVRKYHYLGMLLAKDKALIESIERIKHLTVDCQYMVKNAVRHTIYSLSLDSVSELIILKLQEELGFTDGIETHTQIKELIKSYGDERRKKRLDKKS